MNRKQYVIMLTLALVTGLIGGAVSSRFVMGDPAFAQKTPQSEKIIAAEGFRLVDKNGQTRAEFTVGPVSGESGLTFLAKDGTAVVSIGVNEFGYPSVTVFDKDKNAAILGTMEGSSAGLYLANKGFTPRADLSVAGVDGSPRLYLYDKNSKGSVMLSVLADGIPRLNLFDKDGKRRIGLIVLADGSPSLDFNSNDENLRARLIVMEDGEPHLMLRDKEGKNRVKLALSPDEEPGLFFANRDGKIFWKAP